MQNAHAVERHHAQKNGQPGKFKKDRPPRYFVDGRTPPDVITAQKRLAVIKEEHKRTSNLVNNVTDIDVARQNSRKKFIEHTQKEILLLTEWIENNAEKTASATKTLMSAREKILDTLNFLMDLNKKGLLLTKETMVLDTLVDYSVNA